MQDDAEPTTVDEIWFDRLVLRPRPVIELTDDRLSKSVSLNSDLRLERTADGELVVMPPTGCRRGKQSAGVSMQL